MADAKNVSTGKPKVAGAVYRAPLGTTLPTNATSELAAAFKSLGFISEDGVTNSNSLTSDQVKAWGGAIVLTMQTDRPDTFKFKALESMNLEVLKAYYGDENVSGSLTEGIIIKANTKDLGAYAWVIDLAQRGGGWKRIVIPNAMISGTGDVVYVDDDPVGYEITLTAMPDNSENNHYEYIYRNPEANNDNGDD